MESSMVRYDLIFAKCDICFFNVFINLREEERERRGEGGKRKQTSVSCSYRLHWRIKPKTRNWICDLSVHGLMLTHWAIQAGWIWYLFWTAVPHQDNYVFFLVFFTSLPIWGLWRVLTNTEDVDFSFAEGQIAGGDISETLKVTVLGACTPDQPHLHSAFLGRIRPSFTKRCPAGLCGLSTWWTSWWGTMTCVTGEQ